MPTTRSAALNGQGQRIAIAAARFNAQIVEQLVAGAIDGLTRHGVSADAITVVWCPGSWELALVCRKLAESKKYDAVIACGAVIRGETPHFDYVAGEAAKGLAGVQQATGIPVVFSVLTTDTTDQAWARAGGKAGNKGFDGAMTAVEMVNLLKDI